MLACAANTHCAHWLADLLIFERNHTSDGCFPTRESACMCHHVPNPFKVLITFTLRLKIYCNSICSKISSSSGGEHGNSMRRDMVQGEAGVVGVCCAGLPLSMHTAGRGTYVRFHVVQEG
jgi:hypothetical protein